MYPLSDPLPLVQGIQLSYFHGVNHTVFSPNGINTSGSLCPHGDIKYCIDAEQFN